MKWSQFLVCRHRVLQDAMALASLDNFVLRPVGTCETETLIGNRGVTPYCIDPEEGHMALVGLPREIDLGHTPFVYQAQRNEAVSVYTLPYPETVSLGATLPQQQKVISVYSVPRSGSTFLARILQQVPGVVSLSEPDIYSELVRFGGKDGQGTLLARTTTRLLMASQCTEENTHLALKYRAGVLGMARQIHEAAGGKAIFIYRGVCATCSSAMRAFARFPRGLWLYDQLCRSSIGRVIARPLLARKVEEQRYETPLLGAYPLDELLSCGALGLQVVYWLTAMRQYLELKESGFDIAAVRYEDLLARPDAVLAAIGRHCGLNQEALVRAARTLKDGDSQAGSPLARECQRRWEFTDCSKTAIARLLAADERFADPDFVLPGTS